MAVDPANLPPTKDIAAGTICDLFQQYGEKQHSPETVENCRLPLSPPGSFLLRGDEVLDVLRVEYDGQYPRLARLARVL